jgi:hypothetical protein
VRSDQLTDVGHSQPDAVVALAGADDGKLFAVGQNKLVIDQRLAASDGKLLVAKSVFKNLAFVSAHLI